MKPSSHLPDPSLESCPVDDLELNAAVFSVHLRRVQNHRVPFLRQVVEHMVHERDIHSHMCLVRESTHEGEHVDEKRLVHVDVADPASQNVIQRSVQYEQITFSWLHHQREHGVREMARKGENSLP